MPDSYSNCIKSAEYIKNKIGTVPKTAVVLGSGLGFFVRNLEDSGAVAYRDIPCFPVSTAPSHEGRLYWGKKAGKRVLVFSGRFHYYEGWSFEEAAYYVRVLKSLRVETLILTCAAGGISPRLPAGSLMLVSDHLNLSAMSPCRGQNDENFGPRFFDMTDAYSRELRKTAGACAAQAGIPLKEGVYAYMSGPQYETPAEIRALRALGADAVGMSTVPEVIEAAHCGIKTMCIACITNAAAGVSCGRITDGEVLETARRTSASFEKLLCGVLASV